MQKAGNPKHISAKVNVSNCVHTLLQHKKIQLERTVLNLDLVRVAQGNALLRAQKLEPPKRVNTIEKGYRLLLKQICHIAF